jgi:hypothetical protein
MDWTRDSGRRDMSSDGGRLAFYGEKGRGWIVRSASEVAVGAAWTIVFREVPVPAGGGALELLADVNHRLSVDIRCNSWSWTWN